MKFFIRDKRTCAAIENRIQSAMCVQKQIPESYGKWNHGKIGKI